MESWLPLEEFPGFEISDKGTVRNIKTGKVRKQLQYKNPAVVLPRPQGGTTTRAVRGLVEETFHTFKVVKE
jgi:hypothetical protein